MSAFLALTTMVTASAAVAGNKPIVEPFLFESGGVRIAGEVHSLNRQRCMAVIIVGGSNVRTRSDTAEAVPFFLDPEMAVVLIDRRGNGRSNGQFEDPDTRNTAWQIPRFGRDVAAVAKYLKKRRGYRRVVLAGSSMGGWINDVAAAAAPREIDAVVSINGGASTVGVSDRFDDLASAGVPLDEAAKRARSYQGPQGYDPRRDLRRIRQPVLWVFAAKDASNPTALDLEAVKDLAKHGKRFAWLVLPNADHELIEATTHQFDSSWVQPVRKFIRGSIECPQSS